MIFFKKICAIRLSITIKVQRQTHYLYLKKNESAHMVRILFYVSTDLWYFLEFSVT